MKKMRACEIDSALCEIEDIGDTNNKNNRAIRSLGIDMRFQKSSLFASQDMVKRTLEAVFPDIWQLVIVIVELLSS